jgi:hypothetical protein
MSETVRARLERESRNRPEQGDESRPYLTAAFLLALGVLEYLVFSGSFTQFFQGDALFYMSHRFRSWSEFFHALYSLDIAHWYRPLASQTIQSVFFPWFGLHPYGYHWVVFLLFFVTTCVLFLFIRELTASSVAAAAGTVFFSINWINVYVTYDFAFAPELFYATFYLLSCIAYLRGGRSRRWYLASIVFFVLALMSKEAAVTLPGNLVLLTVLFCPSRDKKQLLPFFGLFAAYYLYIVRFLKVGAGDYVLAIQTNVLSRVEDSFLWAFDLSRGRMRLVVVIAALMVAAYALASLFGSRRRYTLLGVGWFLVALSPMLGIVGYFGLYYLFLPLAGIAVVVGEFFRWLHDALSARSSPKIATAAVLLGLAPFLVAARWNTQEQLYNNESLGLASRIAGNSFGNLKRFHPTVPAGALVYIINPDQPRLTRYFGINALVKLAYDDDSIDVRYSSLGHTVSTDERRSGSLVVMRYVNESLVPADPSEIPEAQLDENIQYVTSDQWKLDVFPTEVVAGKGAYTIRIGGAANTDADLQYRFNDGPLVLATVHLNPNGETRFFVSTETKRGTYRFVGLKLPASPEWFKVAGVVRVTD